ncbi:MAG: M23 family metallopeptidase, partial [Bacteroidota bacterium]
MFRLLRLLLVLLLIIFGTSPLLTGQNLTFLSDTTSYHWPTDATTYLSSTYGETRAAHFHAGLDIRTWGREGYQVFATRDGVVHQIGISPYGYGKVLYLRHEDQSYSVYAHLNRFDAPLQAVIDSIRIANDYQSDINLEMESHQIKVRKGERIAWSGSTGVGPPHLHFELRTPNNEPFNPLLTNLSDEVEDSRPPVFTGLAIEHLNPETFHVERLNTHRPLRRGAVTDLGRHQVNGPVGLSVNVHDRADRTPNIYAVYQLTLRTDTDTLFSSRMESYPMERGTQMYIDRIYPILNRTRAGYQRLYRVNGNQLPFYESLSRTQGIVDLPEGEHELEVVAEDYHGNQTTARITLDVVNRSSIPAWQITSIPAYPRDVELDGIPAGLDRLHEISPFRVTNGFYSSAEGPAGEGQIPPREEGPRQDPLIYYSQEPSISRTSKELLPNRRQFLHVSDQSIWVEFPKEALFDTLRARLSVEHSDGLPIVRMEPTDAPLQKPIRIHAILPSTLDPDKRIAMFGVHPHRGGRRYLGSGLPGEVLRAEVREFMEVHFL